MMCAELVTKKCSKCDEEKLLSCFYNEGRNSSVCKLCTIKRVQEHRKLNIERVREYDRQRRKKSSFDEEAWEDRLTTARQWTKDNPLKAYAIKRRYVESNPKKRDAHVKVGNAIRDGKLLPEPCSVCGSLDVHGHHCDYDKPLEVDWLCAEHHAQWHSQNGEGLNAHY